MKTRYSVVAVALLAIGCSQDEGSQLEPDGSGHAAQAGEGPAAMLPLPVWFFGTVHHVPENGGVWVIRTAGGTQYQPRGLPLEFQVEGMAVEVEARKHDKVATKDKLGQTIDIVEIRKQGGGLEREYPPAPSERSAAPSGGPPAPAANPPAPAESPPPPSGG